ncbi:MAG: helix-turn-helix domain-containing protein [Candidatus Poribacteria bacterium]|nr:helix-turn-helix domain-containing protein [Candidatus Poribacteria bacterium]
MNKEFRIIVVDNDTEEIIGTVTDLQGSGFSMIYRHQEDDTTCSFDSIDNLLNWSQETDNTICYMIGGVRIPLNHTTHDKNYYFRLVGWSNLTPAEAVILGVLQEAKHAHKECASFEYIKSMLTAFGFSPASLRMLLVKLRKKLKCTNLRVENQSSVGYRLIDSVNDPMKEFLTEESRAKSDYWILFCDKKLKPFVTENIEQFKVEERPTGSQILLGWQGLTRTEAEIFFELVKFRSQWVSYEHLLTLPWTKRSSKKQCLMEKYLKNFVGKIRKKIENKDEVILTETLKGYCLI